MLCVPHACPPPPRTLIALPAHPWQLLEPLGRRAEALPHALDAASMCEEAYNECSKASMISGPPAEKWVL